MNKTKDILTVALTSLIVGGLLAAFLILPDAAVSQSERRRLAGIPELSSVGAASYVSDMEKYMLDQFPARDLFRSLNALFRYNVMAQKDNNGIYRVGDSLYKLEYPLKSAQVSYAADRMNWIYDNYLSDMNVYYAVVPDKNVFVAKQNGYLSINYNIMLGDFHERVKNMKYIDIWDCLTADDYYKTDTHWRQENIKPVAERLASSMNAELAGEFNQNVLYPFYGVYHGQSALQTPPDELVYITNESTEKATVKSIEIEGVLPVYDLDKFSGMDGYDVFLSGAQAIITVECDGSPDRELIVFRDSFGSSIAPYFIGAYSKITLVDSRYIRSELLPEFLTFKNQDVLFLYSTSILNNGMLLK